MNTSGGGPDAATESAPIDAPSDGDTRDASIDTGVDAAPECNPLAPFTDIAPLEGVNTPEGEDGAWMSGDELTLYFARTTAGTFDLYVATRPNRASAFVNIVPIAAINGATNDNHPTLGGDSLFFASDREDGGQGTERVWKSVRAPDGSFGSPSMLATIGDPGELATFPYALPGGLLLYYVTKRPNEPGLAIWRAARTSVGQPFGAGVNVSVLNMPSGSSPYLDGYPVVTPDDRTIYFTSYRPTADAGAIGFNVFMATRSSAAAGFSPPVEVTELNTTAEEWPTWISADNCRILFISDRPGSMASRDIWQAHRGK